MGNVRALDPVLTVVSCAKAPPAPPRRALIVAMCGMLFAMAGCKGPFNTAVSRPASPLDFNQDVQPILASNCFSCHGPDPGARKASLRLDLEESAFKKRPGKPDAIVPGHPEQSELIRRIEDKDPHQLMPQSPLGEARPMKPEEIAVLKRWVQEGAHYRPHWAFDKPVKALPPQKKDAAWTTPADPIDQFVATQLAKESLHPAPEADKQTLIRRLTLDLTGLLPTLKEVQDFKTDPSPNAYERVVDRLLASPAYGEQRARYWLDYARYADTYGLHYDNTRHVWPYRDYLIRAFNSNKPFDQFVKEQIAGDMLPVQSLDTVVASAYTRLGVSSNEGGTIPEELKFNMARERTEAYGAAFLGLTVGCAVCHDHKYDPTTQKDFYQLSAFFNNMQEHPWNDDRPNWEPVVRIPKPANLAEYNSLVARRAALQALLQPPLSQQRTAVNHWLRSDAPQAVSTEKMLLHLRLDEGGGKLLHNSAPGASPATFPVGSSEPQWGETTWLWPDMRMDTSARIVLDQTGDFDWNQAFSGGGWMMVRSVPNIMSSGVSGSLISKMDTTQQNRGWDIATDHGFISVDLVASAPKVDLVPVKSEKKPEFKTPRQKEAAEKAAKEKADKKRLAARVRDDKLPNNVVPPYKPVPMKPLTGKLIKVTTRDAVVGDGDWRHIFFTYDGSGAAAGVRIYVNGAAVPTRIVVDRLGHSTIRTSAPLQLGMRSPEAQPARDTRYQDLRLYGRAITADEVTRLPYEDYVAEIAQKPMAQWNADEFHVVSDFYSNNVDATAKGIRTQIAELDSQLEKLSAGGDFCLVSKERPAIAYAHILNRGIYSARKERVTADTPHFLPPLPADTPHDRLALAEWTVSEQNPLTARVAVNRMWYEVFGVGLVETTEDFGIMGGRPSNPQLLDWLAVEFRESQWNVKHMYKLMVMSAAYRRSARATPELLAKDPRNLLLARGPRFRMDAEMLRDIALESSGLLVNKVGGPSVKPYQPANVWESVSYPTSDTLNYQQEHGPALYRRSLYTYWKRMAMPPGMDAFDAPPRDTACTRRQRTDTPLQALVTMNDTQWIEASRALAERLIEQGGKQPQERIRFLANVVLSHDPSAKMEAVLQQSLKQMQAHYTADPKAARDLIAVGEKPRNSAIAAPELAAWTMVVSEMLNLDETLNK